MRRRARARYAGKVRRGATDTDSLHLCNHFVLCSSLNADLLLVGSVRICNSGPSCQHDSKPAHLPPRRQILCTTAARAVHAHGRKAP